MAANASEASCVAIGGHLASIADDTENSLVLSLGRGNHVIAGATDAAMEGTFVWTSGEPVTYTNWAPGEPNNVGNEDCLVVLDIGQWNDIQCDTPQFAHVCETVMP